MRIMHVVFLGALALAAGCDPAIVDDATAVLGVVADSSVGDVPAAAAAPASVSADALTFRMEDRLTSYGDYRLYSLGPAIAGDSFAVTLGDSSAPPVVAVLLDADRHLLMRQYLALSTPLNHVMRAETGEVFLGISSANTLAMDMRVSVRRTAAAAIPPPNPQVVYLNFAGAQNVRVHSSSPITFGAFDSSVLGSPYADQTDDIKALIVQTLADDYAGYDVTFVTSDDGPPAGAYATLHFGGAADALLGLADSIDAYNRNSGEQAVIYVRSFAAYALLGLSTHDMAEMIGNVASHELGHLLGLYHTKDPDDVMDTTGTAYDLAESQAFSRAPLESSVFPTGLENSPMLLEFGVGIRPNAEKSATARAIEPQREAMRRLARRELQHACGTCLRLNEPPR